MRSWLAVVAPLMAVLACARDAGACAPAPPAGREVAIAEEAALVVWEPAKKTEHFVRRAVFRTQAADFGFLVPTPSRPTLAEERDDVFGRLERLVLPETRYETSISGVDPTPLLLSTFSLGKRGAPVESAGVRVLEEKRVGAFDAAVLAADDVEALASWLRDHGYDRRPSLVEWLAPYVEKRWIVTAFKIADAEAAVPGDAGADRELEARVTPPRALGGGTVRMSFETERPFFPYREPADQRDARTTALAPSRSLRVFFVGPTRAWATIGDGTTPFGGKVSWAGPLDPGRAGLPIAPPPGAWLTAFEDDASPRPGVDELWFDPARDRSPVVPPPVVVTHRTPIPIPADVVFALGAVGVVLVRRRRRAA